MKPAIASREFAMAQDRNLVGDHRIAGLLEQILDGRCTPEEACRECPELLSAVRAELNQLRLLQDELAVIFPQRSSSTGASDAVVRSAEKTLPDMPGYDQLELVGSGGMGVVYRARQVALNRVVAIKMVLARGHTGTRHLERFKREAAAVAALRHPNIVQVYDAGEYDGFPFFAMEYVEGGTLAQMLAGMPQPAGKAAEMLATLARAVHAAHVNGTVHRDLKPANILCTSDGTLKISDFGLARSLEEADQTLLTLEGTPVGTPSYMSPEQALGRTDLGPAMDTYALGAILYEMLTGRPPFRGESSLETQRQVISDDPVPPTRLNPRTPRDLQTICLKCLEKAPEHRYKTALALAEDLDHFLRGEPIAARPVSPPERVVRWLRRKPMAAALTGALVVVGLLALALLGSSLHASQKRAATARALQDDLREIAELESTKDWEKIAVVLARAEGRIAEGGTAGLRTEIDQAASDLKLAKGLEDIRRNRAPLHGGIRDKAAGDRAYEAAFRASNLDVNDAPQNVAGRIKKSPLRRTLVEALDDWAVCAIEPRRREWALEVAQLVDPGPDGWCARLRNPNAWQDHGALTEIATAAPIELLPARLLVAAAERLQDLGGDAVEFLKRVDREHPGDFGVNFRLGFALMTRQNPAEAVGYYQAALAIRPNVVVCDNLAYALRASGKLDEAIAYCERAIRMDPSYAPAHNNLGLALKAQGKLDLAIGCFRRALELNPEFAPAHSNLAIALKKQGDVAGAIQHYQESARLAPDAIEPRYNLGLLLAREGRLDEAVERFQEVLGIRPGWALAHSELGNAYCEQARWDEAIVEFRKAIELDPNDSLSHCGLGKALLKAGEHSEEAMAEFERSLALNPELAGGQLGMGKCLQRLGRASEAIEYFEKAAQSERESAAAHASLGETYLALGEFEKARESLRRCLDLNPKDEELRRSAAELLERAELNRAPEP
jgi:serine/threonine-protein kinase